MMRNKDCEMIQVLFPSRLNRLVWLLIPVFLFGAPVMVCAGAQDPPAAPANAPAPDVAPIAPVHEGDAIFHKRCVVCHNKQRGDDSPFGPPNLYTAFHGPTPLATRVAENIIVNGKGQMPAFGTVLSRTEIRQVIAYLKTR
jgi:mono/diheme cytochrome c family protein